MTIPYYIEDIFIEFVDICSMHGVPLQYQDRSAAHSFYQNIQQGNHFTENQAKYVIKILYKYRNVMKEYLDYEDKLELPQWKNPFRVIDLSMKVWVEHDGDLPWICFKFPFQIKESFDEEFKIWNQSVGARSIWDKERKIRKLQLYDFNLIQIYEFAKRSNFEIEDSFMDAMAAIEEIWQSSELVSKRCQVNEDEVSLVNAGEDAINYFNNHKTQSISHNLLLAKNMGYLLDKHPASIIEKIASSPTNTFWIKSEEEFIKLAYETSGKIAIILDRSEESLPWIKNLAETIDRCGFDKSDFRVCFRASNEIDPDFNKWVSKNNFGGKIDTAKFLIFQHKPAKWLFNGENDVIIVASNSLLPSTNTTTKAIFKSHPCVVHIGEYKPTRQKDDIIEL